MSFVAITTREREKLSDLFFKLKEAGQQNPIAHREAMTALRCLKAVHSNAIEDKRVDRIFLQVLLHASGVTDRSKISRHYANAASELRGQEQMLRRLEDLALKQEPFSISLLQEMHYAIFKESHPEVAGKFRTTEVRIKGMLHRPTHHSRIQEQLYQHFEGINEVLMGLGKITRDNFFEVLRLSAKVHYLVAAVHPFEDGNGRVARAAGDYAMLLKGYYYDVIMTDYRDIYLDALEECTIATPEPLLWFIEYSYLETLERIEGFFDLVVKDAKV